jgi:hypothetical protein
MLNDEVCIVMERQSGLVVTDAILLREAVNAVLSKKSAKNFGSQIKDLNVETVLRGAEKLDSTNEGQDDA